jgi:YfiH family protein
MSSGMVETIVPDWPAPANVRAMVTTRLGGVSSPPWDSFNLAQHVGDNVTNVDSNRKLLRACLPAEPVWLNQVHGTLCVDADQVGVDNTADAAYAFRAGVVCAVMTADCLPVLLCRADGSAVAAVHAGWRGLSAGVIEATVSALNLSGELVRNADRPGIELMAWLGPAIGPAAFEVGDEVRAEFIAHDETAAQAFRPGTGGKWWCDIYQLARQRLWACDVRRITSADFCTVSDSRRFFSYRRDGVTGRMASLIWMEPLRA